VLKIATVFGTRPEIIKLSALMRALDERAIHTTIHTGQHYSYNMDELFFVDLKLRKANYTLCVGSGTHAEQTAKIMMGVEEILLSERPDIVIVQGDTNSALGGALAAVKLGIKVLHIEAGCRSFNKAMPEEINRILIDHCSSHLFVTDGIGEENLLREGIPGGIIHLIGSTAMETARKNAEYTDGKTLERFGLRPDKYVLCTIHRSENTSGGQVLRDIVGALNKIAEKIKVLLPLHPRTLSIVNSEKIEISGLISVIEPLGYLEFLAVMKGSHFIMTDSGGVQEEAAALDVPCFVLRNETEWVNLMRMGKISLVSNDGERIFREICKVLNEPAILEGMKRVSLPDANAVELIMLGIESIKD